MTNEELQAHIKAIEAALRAGEVEERHEDNDAWVHATDGLVLIGSSEFEYRIRPELMEFWVNEYPDDHPSAGDRMIWQTPDSAKDGACKGAIRVAIHMREVSPEES